MLRRSVPSHGGIGTSGRSEPRLDGGGADGPRESSGPSVGPPDPDVGPDGDGVASQSSVPLVSFATKMHGSWRTLLAMRSYFATTTWPPAMTRITASSPASDRTLNARRGRPRRPSPLTENAFRKTATR